MSETAMNAIRRGLAANLRAVPDCVVSPWLVEDSVKDCLSVAGPETMEYAEGGFGEIASARGGSMPFIIEGAVSMAGGLRAAQTRFDAWVLWLVPEAIEADIRLTSRLNDNGSVTTDADPACEALAVREFRGYRRTRLGNSTDEFLVGDWVVDLLV